MTSQSYPVHYRNDRYILFKDSRGTFPNMDAIDDKYLVLPLHTRLSSADVGRVVEAIRDGR